MTITAYNIQHFGRPLITFGISVKSEARFRDLFYFLNYAKFDTCINECLEKMNFNKCFESIICENGINIDGSVWQLKMGQLDSFKTRLNAIGDMLVYRAISAHKLP